MPREIMLDRSHYSGTVLDRDVVAFAEEYYQYHTLEPAPEMDDSEGWQWECDEAIMHMNSILNEKGKQQYYMSEDNSLYLVTGE